MNFDNVLNAAEADIITDFSAGDTLYIDVDDETLALLEDAAGDEAKLAALRDEFLLDWSNDSHYDSRTGSNNATIADTVVTHNGEVVLVIEDYTDELEFTQFDIY